MNLLMTSTPPTNSASNERTLSTTHFLTPSVTERSPRLPLTDISNVGNYDSGNIYLFVNLFFFSHCCLYYLLIKTYFHLLLTVGADVRNVVNPINVPFEKPVSHKQGKYQKKKILQEVCN